MPTLSVPEDHWHTVKVIDFSIYVFFKSHTEKDYSSSKITSNKSNDNSKHSRQTKNNCRKSNIWLMTLILKS